MTDEPKRRGPRGAYQPKAVRASYAHLGLRAWGWWRPEEPKTVKPVTERVRGDVDLLSRGALDP